MKIIRVLTKLVLKQYSIGAWLGSIRSVFSNAQFYMGMVNFGMIAILAYDGTVGKQLKVWFPWLNFWLYFLAFVVGYLLLMLFEWKIVTPSIMTMSNEQGYKHKSLLRRDLECIKRNLKVLMKNSGLEYKESLSEDN